MNSTLTRMQKSLIFILLVFCITLPLLGTIGYAILNKEVTSLKEANAALVEEIDSLNRASAALVEEIAGLKGTSGHTDLDEEITSLKKEIEHLGEEDDSIWDSLRELYFRKPLQDHSNYYLLGRVAAGDQKLIKLKNEHDVIYTWSDYINEEYDKARKDEYLSAFKAAISTDEILRERVLYYLHDLCGYDVAMPYTLADPDEADEASKAIALEHFINRLELSPSGDVLYYPFDGDIRPYYTNFTIRYISSIDFDYFDENSGRGPVFKTLENYEPEYNEYGHIWYEYQSAGLCCICF